MIVVVVVQLVVIMGRMAQRWDVVHILRVDDLVMVLLELVVVGRAVDQGRSVCHSCKALLEENGFRF